MRRLAVLWLVAIAALAAGCASPPQDTAEDFTGEKAKVATVIEDFAAATRKADQDGLCRRFLSARSRVLVTRTQRKPCDQALPDLVAAADLRELDVEAVTIDGRRATARVVAPDAEKDDRSTLALVNERGWKLDLSGR
jgi:hypothetical protein